MCLSIEAVLKVLKVQVNAVNKKAKGQNFLNDEVYYFKFCGHHDQGQGVVLKIIGLAVIHPGATMINIRYCTKVYSCYYEQYDRMH